MRRLHRDVFESLLLSMGDPPANPAAQLRRTLRQAAARHATSRSGRRRGRLPRPPRALPPNGIQRRYGRALRRRVLEPAAALVSRIVIPRLRDAVRAAPTPVNAHDSAGAGRRDGYDDVITRAFGDLELAYEREVPRTAMAGEARTMAGEAADLSAANLTRQVRSVLGVDPELSEAWLPELLADAVSSNVALIKTVPERYFAELEQVVRASVRAGMRHEELAQVIASTFVDPDGTGFGKAQRRAELIARDQTSKLNGDMARIRQTELGIERYTWRTALDERVRPEHRELEGQVFTWAAPPSEGPPGFAINCRCIAEPMLEDLLGGAALAPPTDEPAPENPRSPPIQQPDVGPRSVGAAAARPPPVVLALEELSGTAEEVGGSLRLRAASSAELTAHQRRVIDAVTLMTNGDLEVLRDPRSFTGRVAIVHGPLYSTAERHALSARREDYAAANRVLTALARAPGPTRLVFRGMGLPQSILDALGPGAIVPLGSFTSTSLLPGVAEDLAGLAVSAARRVGQRLEPVIFNVTTHRGSLIMNVSRYPGEGEFVTGGKIRVERVAKIRAPSGQVVRTVVDAVQEPLPAPRRRRKDAAEWRLPTDVEAELRRAWDAAMTNRKRFE